MLVKTATRSPSRLHRSVLGAAYVPVSDSQAVEIDQSSKCGDVALDAGPFHRIHDETKVP